MIQLSPVGLPGHAAFKQTGVVAVKDWDDLLAEKKDIHTPRKAWKDLEQDLGDMEILLAVWKTKGGQVHIRTSQVESLVAVGLLDVAKQMHLDGMRID